MKTDRTRYAVCVAPNSIEFRERPLPLPGPREVLIETQAVGLCTSDLVVIAGKHTAITPPTDYIGHEPGGVVAEVGSEVTRFRPGDRVSSLGGEPGPDIRMQFADHYVQHEDAVFHIPDGLSFATGLCEPLAMIVKATLSSGIRPADLVAVVGAGFFGQLLAQSIRLQGAWKVAMFDLLPCRLEIAKLLGADQVYNIQEGGVPRALEELTEGQGFDLVIESAGMPGALDTAAELVRPGGTIYGFGVHAWPETLNLWPWHHKAFRLLNNWRESTPGGQKGNRRFAQIGLDWAARGWCKVDNLITTRPLADLQQAIDEVVGHPKHVMKIVLTR
jgi:L-iditol 2-dehydrogenase